MQTTRTEPARVLPVTAGSPVLSTVNATWYVEVPVQVGPIACREHCGFTSKTAAQRWAASYNRRTLGEHLAAAARAAS